MSMFGHTCFFLHERERSFVQNAMLNVGNCEIDSDIVDIEDTPTGIRLKNYMEAYKDSRIYIGGEFGIGLNSYSRCVGDCYIEDESAYGTFHIGLGRNLALGGAQNAKGHFDLVCLEPDIYADNRQLMQEGKIILPEPNVY